MTTLEICRIQVRDIVKKNGHLTKCFAIKGDVNRDFYLSNIKLQNHIKRLLADSGIDQPSILSGRRTFAVRLKRHGVDVPTIHLMLGNKSLDTTLRLIETDTVSMLAIADMAF
ncbi:hypothetical protein [Vibrio sp. THAF190c]|uniref:hypothetical protein n=1 Tax=Vibrio sp. THAF190c TaxID=2587865 RepID=UPI0012A8166E|nr:hypothetical protein [Vibrio sp. THAF190c]QFT13468.1 hypothetical protein FIV04_26295 [Vibrio sp. THAF190c]